MSEDEHCQAAFRHAIADHQAAMEKFGEDDPRTINALLMVMLTAPDSVFAEVEEYARATCH